jgi:ankyrin repeat protein
LHIAAKLDNIELLTYFFELPYHFGIYQADKVEGRTILHYAIKNKNEKMVQLVINEWHKYLKYSEANKVLYEQACMLRDISEKSTALHYAVNTQRFIILYILMSQIYDCNYLAKNNQKLTALELALKINFENNYTDDRTNPFVV